MSDETTPVVEGTQGESVFQDVNPYSAITKVDSMCMECEEMGTTKDIVISRFYCPHCGYENKGIDNAGKIQSRGHKFAINVKDKDDLNRSVVKSDTCVIQVPHLEFEIPASTQKGTMTTVEGILQKAYDNLDLHQSARRLAYPEQAAKVDEFLQKLQKCLDTEEPFTFIVDDPAGNSYVSSPFAPAPDPRLIETDYERTREQDQALGISDEQRDREMFRREREAAELERLQAEKEGHVVSDEFARPSGSKVSQLMSENIETAMRAADLEKDVVNFIVPCTNCPQDGRQSMVKINIPYFKEVVVMSFVCDHCGEKNNEIKVGGGIPPKGRRYRLEVNNPRDLSRDILKSESSVVSIPEIDFEMGLGSMGGQFTTVEGLLVHIRQALSSNPFAMGDSDEQAKDSYLKFSSAIEEYRLGEKPFTLILDDPVAHSYIQNLMAPDPDPQLTHEDYERTYEQDDELGLHDMVVENYYDETEEKKDEDETKEKKDEDEK